MDRATLFSELAEEINRQDKEHLMPTWLIGAEFRLNNLLRDREMIARAILQVTERVFPGPPDFLEAESLSIQDGTINGVPNTKRGSLFYIPATEVDNDTDNRFVTASPQWFTTRGSKYIELVGWTGTGDFQVQLYYYAKLPALTEDNHTNWLLDSAPHLYKSAMKYFAYTDLEEYTIADRFLAATAAECQAMNDRSQAMKYGTGPLIRRPNPVRFGGRHS